MFFTGNKSSKCGMWPEYRLCKNVHRFRGDVAQVIFKAWPSQSWKESKLNYLFIKRKHFQCKKVPVKIRAKMRVAKCWRQRTEMRNSNGSLFQNNFNGNVIRIEHWRLTILKLNNGLNWAHTMTIRPFALIWNRQVQVIQYDSLTGFMVRFNAFYIWIREKGNVWKYNKINNE